MLIHLLTFSNPQKINSLTQNELDLLRAAAQKQGHQLVVIFAKDCQMKFDRKPSLLIKNHEHKKINVVIVRANFLTNIEFKNSLIRQFELAGIKVINRSVAVRRAKNKLNTVQILTEAKIPVPKTYIVNHAEYLDDVINDIGRFPVILKTTTGSHGSGVSIIESRRGLKSIIDMITKNRDSEPLIIQEYVKESKGKDLRVFIIKKRIIGAMERIATKKGEFRSNFHLGGRVRVATLSPEEKKIAFKAVAACGLDFAGVDIIRTNSGPKILEVNANPGLEGITLATGRDIAGEIIKYAVKKASLSKKNKK